MKKHEILQRTAWKISEITAILGEMTSSLDDGEAFNGYWELGYYTLILSVDKKGEALVEVCDGQDHYSDGYSHKKSRKQWGKVCQAAGLLHLLSSDTKVIY
jgi:hypothetical protein